MIDPAEARELLADRRREAGQRLAGTSAERAAVVAASRDSNADDEHDPEGATIADDRLRALPTVRTCRACAGRTR